MIRRLGFHFSGEEGWLLENLVYIELSRRGGEIFYHNSGSTECDFVVNGCCPSKTPILTLC